MSADYRIVIPARMASQRLPGKPLLSIAGRPLLEHVYRQACKSGAGGIVIATDDRKVEQAAAAFGAEVLMTSQSHRSGSDRIAECADKLCWSDQQRTPARKLTGEFHPLLQCSRGLTCIQGAQRRL